MIEATGGGVFFDSRKAFIVLGLVVLSLYLLVYWKFAQSSEIQEVKSAIREITFISEQIGEDAILGRSFSFYRKGGSGKRKEMFMQMMFPISGARGSGEIKVKGVLHDGEFQIESLHLFQQDACFVARGEREKQCEAKRIKRWQRGRRWLGLF